MSWRQILESNPKDNRDRKDKSPSEDPFCHFSPVERELKNGGIWNEFQLPCLNHLTDGQREAFWQYVEIMTSSKFNLPLDRAEREAMRLVLRAKLASQVRQSTKMEK